MKLVLSLFAILLILNFCNVLFSFGEEETTTVDYGFDSYIIRPNCLKDHAGKCRPRRPIKRTTRKPNL